MHTCQISAVQVMCVFLQGRDSETLRVGLAHPCLHTCCQDTMETLARLGPVLCVLLQLLGLGSSFVRVSFSLREIVTLSGNHSALAPAVAVLK